MPAFWVLYNNSTPLSPQLWKYGPAGRGDAWPVGATSEKKAEPRCQHVTPQQGFGTSEQQDVVSERDTFSVFSEIGTVYSGAVFRMPNGNNGGSLIFTYDHRDSLF